MRTANQGNAQIEGLEPRRLLAFFGIDPAFGSGGFATVGFGPVYNSGVQALGVLPSGKVLAVGQGYQNFHHITALARFNADGSLDTTYGTAGTTSGLVLDTIADSAIGADGSALILGEINRQSVVVRYSPDGTLDTTFGIDGIAAAQFGIGDKNHFSYPTQFAVQADGKIVVVGDYVDFSLPGGRIGLARLNADGRPDTSFDTDGQKVLEFDDFPQARGFAIDGDGKLLISGDRSVDNNPNFLLRLNSDGSLDTTFDTDGEADFSVSTNSGLDFLSAVKAQADGKVLVGVGNKVARFNADGTADSTFGTNGSAQVAVPDIYSNITIHDIEVDGNDNILAVADSYSAGVTVSRLTPNGTLDTTFSLSGKLSITEINLARTLALASNGDIYVGRDSGFSVGKLSPRPDVDLGTDGALRIVGTNSADTITVAPSGNGVRVTRNGVVTTFSGAASAITIDAGEGDNVINLSVDAKAEIITGGGDDTITAGNLIKNIQAGDGDNHIIIGTGRTLIVTGSGNDSITTGGGGKTIQSGEGNDTITTGSGGDSISDTGGNNRISTGAGDDSIILSAGNNQITAGIGDDQVFASDGQEQISLGAGNDQYNSNLNTEVTLSAGAGDDTIESEFYDVIRGYINAGDGDDSIAVGINGDDVTVSGGAGDDTISTFGLATINGGAGNDNIHAIGSSSVIHGGPGRDFIRGSDSADSIFGDASADTLFGSYGSDLLSGGGGADRLFGQSGKDRLYGGTGNDQLTDGPGLDRVFGQGGNDTFYSFDGFSDILDGGAGTDSATVDLTLDVLSQIETSTTQLG